MTGVLDGVTVLDLTDGIAGPVTAMLLFVAARAITQIIRNAFIQQRPTTDPSTKCKTRFICCSTLNRPGLTTGSDSELGDSPGRGHGKSVE